jgi:hypothetical protein
MTCSLSPGGGWEEEPGRLSVAGLSTGVCDENSIEMILFYVVQGEHILRAGWLLLKPQSNGNAVSSFFSLKRILQGVILFSEGFGATR